MSWAMNKIVREHYPVENLPSDLQQLLPGEHHVRLVIETEAALESEDKIFDAVFTPPERVRTLDELLAARRPPFKTTEEIVAEIRQQRDEWDD